jgi:uncharacterized membrane protein YccF (DUF307 family)
MSALGNLIWIVFGGFGICVGYLTSGLIACATIIGIPFGIQLFKLAIYSLLPFGRTVRDTGGAASALANLIWIVLAGWSIALSHIVLGALFAITLIGLPFAKKHFELAALALFPFGKEID